jgi:hypothetical protein
VSTPDRSFPIGPPTARRSTARARRGTVARVAERRQREVELQVEDLLVRDLRVSFVVERTLRRTPNRAEVVAYNVAARDRARLQSLASRGVRVSLRVGYRSEGLSQVFLGDVRRVTVERQGAEVGLRLSAGDGLARLRGRMSPLSFSAGTDLGSVLRRVVGESGLDPGNALEVARGLGSLDVGDGGLSLGTDPTRAITAVTSRAGLEWSVQDGQVQVLQVGAAVAGARAVVLRAGAGLVGNPAEDELGVLSATCLLDPAVVPGGIVRLESPDLSGDYRVQAVTYEGDTGGQQWYCQVKARRPLRR